MMKKRKNMEKNINIALIIAMIVSLFAGILTMEVKAASSTHTHNGITFKPVANASDITGAGNYYLTNNIMVSSVIKITSGTVNLCLNGYKIYTSSGYNSSLFYVESAILNIYDCQGGGILTGGKGYLLDNDTNQKGGAIYLKSSTLNMYGGTITGNSAIWGGAIFIDGSAGSSTFNMYGGTISSNTASKGGGGIEVENSSSYFNMYAGSITNNTVTNVDGGLHKGGGVHFAAGTVKIYGTSGDVIIKDNTVAGIANNVYLRSGKVITVPSGANISSNSSIGVSSADCEGDSNQVTIVNGYGSNNSDRCFFLDDTNASSCLLVYANNAISIVKKTYHTHNIVQQSAIDATCDEDGRKACYVCSGCGNLYNDAQGNTSTTLDEITIEKLGHDWEQVEVVAPTIDNVGVIRYLCSNCRDTKEDELHISINDEKITIEAENTLTYNGQAQLQKLKVYYDGELLSEGIHYTLSDNDNTNAGDYNLTITGNGAFNGERQFTYTIEKASLTVTAEDILVAYGDATPTYTVTYSGFVNDENQAVLGGELAFDCAYVQFSNAGDYYISASGYESSNYNITYVNGKLTVKPKEVELVWSNTTLIYNGQVQQPTASLVGLVNNDACEILVSGEQKNVGDYTATVLGITNTNYKLPAEILSTDYTINPKSIIGATVTLDNTLVYTGEELTQLVKSVVLDGVTLVDSDFVVSLNKGTNAGSYMLSVNGTGNYCDSENKAFEIGKANLTVKVEDKIVTYGDEAPPYTVTYSGFVNNEAMDVLSGVLAFDCAYAQYSDVGDYDITASGYESDNYEITYVKGNVKVNQKVVGLDWSNLVFVYNGNAKIPSVNVTGIVNGDDCTVTVTGEGIDAGIYTATATDLSNNNYKLPEIVTVEFVIQKASEADEVTSDDKEVLEEALEIIEDLLSEENVGNLSAEEKAKVEEQKAELEEKLKNIKEAEEKLETVEDTVNELPEANEVTSENKTAIEAALEVIEDLLSEENAGNLTAEEKAKIEKQKAELVEKLDNIIAMEEKLETVEDTVNELPKANEVTGEDKTAIENILEAIEELLSEENAGNLTAEEKAALEEERAELIEKLEVIHAVEDKISVLQNEKNKIPSKDVITIEAKEEIAELLNIINDLQKNKLKNLTKEQRDVIEKLREELKEKQDRINEIEASLNQIENDTATLPDYDDITSDNKEDIKDIIENIDSIIKGDKDNLSEEEIKVLEGQKKELEEKLEFIQQIENYEPVVDDFKNTTEPEKNDKNGKLQNEAHELIKIIPLEKTEKEHIAKGENVKVYLEVIDITETVTEEDKELIETELEKEEVAVYLDLTLFKQIGNREPKKIPNTNAMVTITFKVPSDLINHDTLVTRIYKIVRVHEGETSIIDAVFDEATGEVSFETDKFSTYALIYDDVAVKAPQTDDTTAIWPWMSLIMVFGMLVLAGKVTYFECIK